ncbi:hypothetical protein BK816_00785 [Boudabousia tangfeifanii]|uniref:ABC3 transporter permease C-terminal domain-containing protein n=1 Tax=Boudabousia tangfeifanii TaxID=1912795 RepID=A0A1D9MI58_9ACTO|nr:FtsX family ABC transporter permease [Boudabousia tangfeifanii]AOZ72011.1 hypothetical protein BK816_00785 [Boudabousia tangfeifanii]
MTPVIFANLREHWGRYVASMVTIILATAFATITLMFGQTFSHQVERDAQETYAGIQLVASNLDGKDGAAGENNEQIGTIDEQKAVKEAFGKKLEELNAKPGINLIYDNSRIASKARMAGSENTDIYLQILPVEAAKTNGTKLVEGAWPTQVGEITMAKSDMNALKLKIGDQIEYSTLLFKLNTQKLAEQIKAKHPEASAEEINSLVEKEFASSPDPLQSQYQNAKIVGIVEGPEARGPEDYVTKEAFWYLSAPQGEFAINTDNPEQAQADVKAMFPQAKFETAQSLIDQRVKDSASIQLIVTSTTSIFPAIALIVSTIIVSSTFRVVIYDRRRELALMRCIGASKKQLRRLLVGEQIIIGFVSGLLGLILGVLIALWGLPYLTLTRDAADTLTTLHPWMIASILILSVLITLFSGIGPIRALGKVSPITALTESSTSEDENQAAWKLWVSAILLLAIGIPVGWYGIHGGIQKFGFSVIGVAMAEVGALLIFARLVPIILRGFGSLTKRTTLRLAAKHADQFRGRTAATAGAIMLAISLVTMTIAGGGSAGATAMQGLNQRYPVDGYAESVKASLDAPLKESELKQLETFGKDPQIASFSIVKQMSVHVMPTDDTTDSSSATNQTAEGAEAEGRTIDSLSMKLLDASDLAKAAPAGAINDKLENDTLYLDAATKKSLKLGDKVKIEVLRNNGEKADTFILNLQVPEQKSLIPTKALSAETFAKLGPLNMPQEAYFMLKPQADSAQANVTVTKMTNDYPDLNINTIVQARTEIQKQLNRLTMAVSALLGVSALVAIIGVGNTMTLSVASRKRETGLLRALGLSRKQSRRVVLWEALGTALLSSVIGIGLGLSAAYLGLIAMDLEKEVGTSVIFSPNWPLLLAAGAIVILGTLLAAYFPARRAAKVPPVSAINS